MILFLLPSSNSVPFYLYKQTNLNYAKFSMMVYDDHLNNYLLHNHGQLFHLYVYGQRAVYGDGFPRFHRYVYPGFYPAMVVIKGVYFVYLK
jgi:hypothetical protein